MNKEELSKNDLIPGQMNNQNAEIKGDSSNINQINNEKETKQNLEEKTHKIEVRNQEKMSLPPKEKGLEIKKEQKEENKNDLKAKISSQEEYEATVTTAQEFLNAKLFQKAIETSQKDLNRQKNIELVSICAFSYFKLNEINKAIKLIENYFQVKIVTKYSIKEYETLKNLADFYYVEKLYKNAIEKIEKCKSILIELNFKGDKESELEKLNIKLEEYQNKIKKEKLEKGEEEVLIIREKHKV